MMGAREQIVWAAVQQQRPLHEITCILNRVPKLLCGRSEPYSDEEVHGFVHDLIDEWEAGNIVEAWHA